MVAFQTYLPLISAVCNPGLRERHWEALAELVGFTIKQDEVSLPSSADCVYKTTDAMQEASHPVLTYSSNTSATHVSCNV